MAVKRRTLWFTDDDWSKMRAAAVERGMNVSQLIRSVVLHDGTAGKPAEGAPVAQRPWSRSPSATGMAQAERDAILAKVNRPR